MSRSTHDDANGPVLAPTVKAVVLAAGGGSRMRRAAPGVELGAEQRRIADLGLKTLIPVAGRPLLAHLIDRLRGAGIERVCVVVGPRQRELARWCRERGGSGVEVAIQRRPRGTADALLAGRDFCGHDPFLMTNADNLCPVADLRRLAELPGCGFLAFNPSALVDDPGGNIDARRLSGFAVAELDESGGLRRMAEKPSPSRLAGLPGDAPVSLNFWRFSPRIFAACRAIAASERGEWELPTAVEHAIANQGERFTAVPGQGPVLDLTHRRDVPVLDRLLSKADRSRSAGSTGGGDDGTARGDAVARRRYGRLLAELEDRGAELEDGVDAWFVPGRIELFGKHTDYAGGRSLLAATEQGVAIVAAARSDARLRIVDLGRGEEVELDAVDGPAPDRHWSRYPAAVARRLARDFPRSFRGVDAVFDSDLPAAAGLSSSSALIVAFFFALAAANRLEEDPRFTAAVPGREALAAYLGAVERGGAFGPLDGGGGVGTRGGDGDHTAILCSRAGETVVYRYLPSRFERAVALPPGTRLAVAVSGVEAAKADGARQAFNRVSRLAAAAAEVWRSAGGTEPHLGAIAARGPETLARLDRLLGEAGHAELEGVELRRRVGQFVEESERLVPAAADALDAGDRERLGALATRSHRLAATALGNQTAETDHLAATARAAGAWAASAFGAGFGGSVWALVPSASAGQVVDEWSRLYFERFPHRRDDARFLVTRAAAAARRVEVPA